MWYINCNLKIKNIYILKKQLLLKSILPDQFSHERECHIRQVLKKSLIEVFAN